MTTSLQTPLVVSEKSNDACSQLHPSSPALSSVSRYESVECFTPAARVIQPGLFSYSKQSQSPTLPQGWATFVQPEGQRYFACEIGLRVVTNAYIYTKSTEEKILHYAAVVAEILDQKDIHLPDSAELYLSPREDDENDENDGCDYYIADHASHTISWLEPVETEDIGIAHSVSESNLRFSLEELYWLHVELFPSHRINRLHLALDELIPVFIHGECDQRTSQTSTFPYSAEQCKHYLRTLQYADNISSPQTVWVVARLWAAIARHRQETYYAQEQARLDRTQRVLDLPMTRQRVRNTLFSATSRVLFGVPRVYQRQLEKLWSDSLVYLYVWHDFMLAAQAEWRQYLTWSLGMSIINLLFFLVPGASAVVAALSLACCGGAALIALALLTHHHSTSIKTLDDATPFLITSNANQHRRAALSFALPRALFLWAAVLAGAQGLVWLARACNAPAIAASAWGWSARTAVRFGPGLLERAQGAMNIVWVHPGTSMSVLGAFAALALLAFAVRLRYGAPSTRWLNRDQDQERDVEKA